MSQGTATAKDLDLKRAERKVLGSAFDDGLWDVLIGCFVLMFFVLPLLSSSRLGDFWSAAISVPLFGVAYLVIYAIRRRVLAYRIGVVKLGQSHKLRLMRFNIVIMVVLLVGLILGLISTGNIDGPILRFARILFAALGVTSVRSVDVQGLVHAIRFGLTVLVAFSVAAFFLEFRRLYVYGVLLALSPLIGEWLYRKAGVPHHGFPVAFGATGAVIILVGLVNFARLIRGTSVYTETLPPEETQNGRSTK